MSAPPPPGPGPARPPSPAQPAPAVGALYPTSFAALPSWMLVDARPALAAFQRTCDVWSGLSPQTPIGRRAPYGGRVGDWSEVCAISRTNPDPLQFFSTQFTPFVVAPSAANSKLTGYFEPELAVQRFPGPGFEAAIPTPPADLVDVNPSLFDPALPNRRFKGQVADRRVRPYPPRADIVDDPGKAVAFGDPGEVFYLQIQGSGRLSFPDGSVIRAAFAAHNDQPFRSIARHLIDTGTLTPAEASMSGIQAWLRSVPRHEARAAMNINPRYVWFQAEAINDPGAGPRGAQGAPLTPMGSVAVDPAHHPYGAPMFLSTILPNQPGDWRGRPANILVVAQDTGGAIKGVRRGDLFFGWGREAGGRAASMNHPTEMVVLLPNRLAASMLRVASRGGDHG